MGASVGTDVGEVVGAAEGAIVGMAVGAADGDVVGVEVGDKEGDAVGLGVGAVGAMVGDAVGPQVTHLAGQNVDAPPNEQENELLLQNSGSAIPLHSKQVMQVPGHAILWSSSHGQITPVQSFALSCTPRQKPSVGANVGVAVMVHRVALHAVHPMGR